MATNERTTKVAELQTLGTQPVQLSLKDLARRVLATAGVAEVAQVAGIAPVAAVAQTGLPALRLHLLALAERMGIPRSVVDTLPSEDLLATDEQAAVAKGHLDGNGDPLAHSLLVFYLRQLAEKESAP